jgi:DNA-binding transcriptional regulator LsrR (DeoR family)
MAGTYKVPAIVAALKGELFNVLFTDEVSARQIVETA